MNDDQVKKIVLSLYAAETENEVEEILKKNNLWDEDNWHPLGEDTRNYATIGNQSAKPIEALVEKIVNSIDAVLMRECLKEGIDPESEKAPKNMVEAQERFFQIPNGHLTNVGMERRKQLAENIYLNASGSKERPCISIIDKGEGQEPDRFKKTLLNITKSEKFKIKFVQGKWGMGGSGSLVFSSPKHRLQLIISKRNDDIKDRSDSRWGFTLTRYFPPTGDQRMEIYKYLAPNNEILAFNSDTLDLIPYQEKKGSKVVYKALNSGTVVKLYEYNFNALTDGGRVRGYITRHLNNHLSTLLPSVPIPFYITDQRYPTFSGMRVFKSLNMRLIDNSQDEDDPEENKNLVEDYFTARLKVFDENLEARIYLFKYDYSKKSQDQGRKTFAEGGEGILLTCNGQTHGNIHSRFFRTKKVGMDVLSNSILVLLELSNTSTEFQHKIFMNSRDRLRDSEEKNEIQEKLAEILKNNPMLKAAREKRIHDKANVNLEENKSFQDALEKIIKQNKSLTSVLSLGTRIVNPFSQIEAPEDEKQYEGLKFPTFFKTKKPYQEEKPRSVEKDRVVRVEFETDASNDYFSRDDDSGNFELYLNEEKIEYDSISLFNGSAYLNLNINDQYNIDDKYKFTAVISDIDKPEPIKNDFWIQVVEKKETIGGKSNRPKAQPNPEDDSDKKTKKTHSGFNIPDIKLVSEENWSDFDMDSHTGLVCLDASEDQGYLYRVNGDNIYLLNEIKANKKIDARILKSKYALALSFIAISLLQSYESKKDKDLPEDFVIQDHIKKVTSEISLVILPIINSLGIDDKDLLDIVDGDDDEFFAGEEE